MDDSISPTGVLLDSSLCEESEVSSVDVTRTVISSTDFLLPFGVVGVIGISLGVVEISLALRLRDWSKSETSLPLALASYVSVEGFLGC